MKKESAKILGIVLISVMLILLVSQFVIAQDIFDPVKDMFAKWEEGELSVNIAKYLFFAMLIILVYAIIGSIPILKDMGGPDFGWFLKLILSVIIGFLATAYLTPSEVYAMLASYSAMGFVLAAGLPFVILIFFTIEISKTGGAGGKLFAKLMWFAFIAFLIYKLIAGWADPNNPLTVGMALAYLIAIFLALVYILFFNKVLLKMWFKEELESAGFQLERKLELQQKKRELEAESAAKETK